MATTHASVQTCRPQAGVAEHSLTRASTIAHDECVASGQIRSLQPVRSRLRDTEPVRSLRSGRARGALSGASVRRRLERDLHDGVQSELVALIVKRAVAQQAPETPRALAHMLAAIQARAQAALDSVRNIARGIHPPMLADLDIREALRAQPLRVPARVSIAGMAPRSEDEVEAGGFSPAPRHSRMSQNVWAGRRRSRSRCTTTARWVRVEDDGRGFDPAQTRGGAGLGIVRDRVEAVGGRHELSSSPGRGTVLAISLPWPARQPSRKRPKPSRTLFRLLVVAVLAAVGARVLLAAQASAALPLAAAAFAVLAVCATRAAERRGQDAVSGGRARRVMRRRSLSLDLIRARIAVSPGDGTPESSRLHARAEVPSDC